MRNEITQMQSKLADQPHLQHLGRLFSATVLLKVDDGEHYLTFRDGLLADIQTGPSKKIPYQVGFVTDGDAMKEFWTPLPRPGFHDIFGLVKIGRAEILGDILVLVKNLRFLKAVLALPRGERA